MRKNYIATIDRHLSGFQMKGEDFGKEIDETISQLEQVILNAQDEINQLQSFRRVVTRFTWPEYEQPEPEMPKTAELPQQEPSQMQNTLDDTDLEQSLADSIIPKDQAADQTQQPA